MTAANFNWFLHVMLFFHTQQVINKQSKPKQQEQEEQEEEEEEEEEEELR